jgi:hypothetical protein
MKKQYIGISRDHSGSMYTLTRQAMLDYNGNIESIREAAVKTDIDTIVSTVKCGVGPGLVEREAVNSSVSALKPITHYATEGQTPLFDSVGELVELLEKVPDASEPDVSFLVMAITDGQENASQRYTADKISKLIREKQASDRWTFVFRVPHGYARALTYLGIPAGNIQEWEQTERGFKESSNITRQAFNGYYGARACGQTATDSFFANAANLSAAQLRGAMQDISHEVKLVPVQRAAPIREFVEYHIGNLKLGAAFYQLTKPEKVVHSDRVICIRDKSSRKIYAGQATARDLLGLPKTGAIKLQPGDHGNYEIFVQSRSVNRKLVPGSTLLYWPSYAKV